MFRKPAHISDPTQSQDIPMSDDYTPPKVWTPGKENGGQFASINKPTALIINNQQRQGITNQQHNNKQQQQTSTSGEVLFRENKPSYV